MRNTSALLLILATAAILSSCQKEVGFQDDINSGGGNGNSKPLPGDYMLVYEEVYEKASIEDNTGGINTKLVIEGSYTLKNIVGGLVKISNNKFDINYGYDIDTTINAKTYIGGVLFDEQDLPVVASVPPTSSSLTYVRNNADSLTFDAPPDIPTLPGGTAPPPIGPMGARISWAGDTLILKTKLDFTTTTTGLLNVKTTTTMKLKKI